MLVTDVFSLFFMYPRHSMYGNVGKYAIHGVFGYFLRFSMQRQGSHPVKALVHLSYF